MSLENRLRIRPNIEMDNVHKAVSGSTSICVLFATSIIHTDIRTYVCKLPQNKNSMHSMFLLRPISLCSDKYYMHLLYVLHAINAVSMPYVVYLLHVCTVWHWPLYEPHHAINVLYSPMGLTSKNLTGTRRTAVNILLCSFLAALTQT